MNLKDQFCCKLESRISRWWSIWNFVLKKLPKQKKLRIKNKVGSKKKELELGKKLEVKKNSKKLKNVVRR